MNEKKQVERGKQRQNWEKRKRKEKKGKNELVFTQFLHPSAQRKFQTSARAGFVWFSSVFCQLARLCPQPLGLNLYRMPTCGPPETPALKLTHLCKKLSQAKKSLSFQANKSRFLLEQLSLIHFMTYAYSVLELFGLSPQLVQLVHDCC